jgi:hypothetical protein
MILLEEAGDHSWGNALGMVFLYSHSILGRPEIIPGAMLRSWSSSILLFSSFFFQQVPGPTRWKLALFLAGRAIFPADSV